jgi:hypothetical protein
MGTAVLARTAAQAMQAAAMSTRPARWRVKAAPMDEPAEAAVGNPATRDHDEALPVGIAPDTVVVHAC